ncbi:hypothetical protein [Streptomyces sp. NPDC055058]
MAAPPRDGGRHGDTKGEPSNAPPALLAEHFTRAETAEFHRPMTHLVATCRDACPADARPSIPSA